MATNNYENAPATKMLATHCAACARPLLDAKSVELGIGPDCRKKHGYTLRNVSEEDRARANQIVHEIACAQTGLAAATGAVELTLLGFEKLAKRILERVSDIRIVEAEGSLVVHAPYNEAAVAGWRQVPGRRWDREAKANRVPARAKGALWTFLKAYYPGAIGHGPRGVFEVS